MPPPTLPDELLEEIFLCLPPGEPACLARASLASKLCLGILTSHRFHRRYSEFHGAPPMLGFFHYSFFRSKPSFSPTVKFVPQFPDDWGNKYSVWDCRHGRVLLQDKNAPPRFFVWDPMTGSRKGLCAPEDDYNSLRAVVLCAATGCDHHACPHEGPSRVVFVSLDRTDGGFVARAYVSMLEKDAPSKPFVCLDMQPSSVLHLASDDVFPYYKPPVLIQDAVYFMHGHGGDGYDVEILKYDLSSDCLSLHDAPRVFIRDSIHMAMEDGSLGFAHVARSTLYLWSRQMGSDGVESWTQHRDIDLKKFLPIGNPLRLELIGSVEGDDTIFVRTDAGIYELNLKSVRCKKLWNRATIDALFPYMSFYSLPERGIIGNDQGQEATHQLGR